MNHAEAEDLTSISFLKLYMHLDGYDGEKSLPQTYLFRIARNTLTDYYRSAKNHVSLDEITDMPAAENENDDRYILEQLLSMLSEKERQILYYRYKLEMSVKETADLMELSVTGVTTACSRAIEKSRKNFEKLFPDAVTNSGGKTYIITEDEKTG
jgi:RNA polymerase sigma-70 factor (ECF subfamily)